MQGGGGKRGGKGVGGGNTPWNLYPLEQDESASERYLHGPIHSGKRAGWFFSLQVKASRRALQQTNKQMHQRKEEDAGGHTAATRPRRFYLIHVPPPTAVSTLTYTEGGAGREGPGN